MKVSIDYDGTFAENSVMFTLLDLFKDHDIYILTARKSHKDNTDLYTTCFKQGIPPHRILFSDTKYQVINALGIEIHIDDNKEMLEAIAANTKCLAVDVMKDDWIEVVEKELRKKKSDAVFDALNDAIDEAEKVKIIKNK